MFPFFEWNEDEKKIDFSHNPFSMPQGGMDAITNAKNNEDRDTLMLEIAKLESKFKNILKLN